MKNKYIAKRYWKDKSTAMGKSDEDVKEAADFVTDDNEHDGVAAAIIKHVL